MVLIDLIALMREYKDDPNLPETIRDIPALVEKCNAAGRIEAGKYLEEWYTRITYHIEAEWNDSPSKYRTT